MKRSEIVIAGIYSNGKGSVREVLGFQKEGLCGGVQDTDNVCYKTLASRYKGIIGKDFVSTARSFASWAKQRED